MSNTSSLHDLVRQIDQQIGQSHLTEIETTVNIFRTLLQNIRGINPSTHSKQLTKKERKAHEATLNKRTQQERDEAIRRHDRLVKAVEEYNRLHFNPPSYNQCQASKTPE
jgi:hypothetical protein